jgi:enoyl-CoA hydratase/carnithine racemase
MSIDITREGHVAVITINRPERRNALDADHYAALSEAWQQVRDDAGIHAAVVTGAGDKAFCAGADIKSFVGRDVALSEHWLTQKGQLLNRGLEVWKPIICAINGACVGGGMTLMMATDIRVAAQGAKLGLAEVKRGIVAANGGTQRIMSQVPYAIAMEMLLLGETIEAEEAARWGLVNRVVRFDDVLPTALDIASRIAANAPLAVQASKELAIRGQDMDLATGLRMEQMVNKLLHGSEDTAEAKAAFSEKRTPDFKGN